MLCGMLSASAGGLRALGQPWGGEAVKRKLFLMSVVMYGSVALAVFIVVTMLTGMAAYFAKTFYHIPPRWLFGLFD